MEFAEKFVAKVKAVAVQCAVVVLVGVSIPAEVTLAREVVGQKKAAEQPAVRDTGGSDANKGTPTPSAVTNYAVETAAEAGTSVRVLVDPPFCLHSPVERLHAAPDGQTFAAINQEGVSVCSLLDNSTTLVYESTDIENRKDGGMADDAVWAGKDLLVLEATSMLAGSSRVLRRYRADPAPSAPLATVMAVAPGGDIRLRPSANGRWLAVPTPDPITIRIVDLTSATVTATSLPLPENIDADVIQAVSNPSGDAVACLLSERANSEAPTVLCVVTSDGGIRRSVVPAMNPYTMRLDWTNDGISLVGEPLPDKKVSFPLVLSDSTGQPMATWRSDSYRFATDSGAALSLNPTCLAVESNGSWVAFANYGMSLNVNVFRKKDSGASPVVWSEIRQIRWDGDNLRVWRFCQLHAECWCPGKKVPVSDSTPWPDEERTGWTGWRPEGWFRSFQPVPSPDGKWLAGIAADGRIAVVDVATQLPVHIPGAPPQSWSRSWAGWKMAWRKDGRALALACGARLAVVEFAGVATARPQQGTTKSKGEAD